MKYEIIRSENEEKLIKDIEERLDSITWCKDYNKQIMFVPVGIVSREGKVGIVLHTDKVTSWRLRKRRFIYQLII